ncbi:RNA polymerase sigma factor [Bacillus mesophilum]|uniref:RNA polymerase sigma factor n=1 Tax=Bacillus mesophilum TaxID=1071718 RepID=A0A7V7V0H7_9BACI|nr:RNA polymerase sigma factor [Bacillus mesophilum]KAB2335177.1 RNA polymerase sigma factor [Bacillus mesophilum]
MVNSVSDSAFEQIYDEYSDKIYSYIFLLVHEKGAAEDLTQDTFIRAYKYMHQFNGESHIFTWLIKISRHIAIDYLRKKNRFLFIPIEHFQFGSQGETPQEIILKGEKIEVLYKAIKKLKLSYQEVIILRKIKEFSIKDTASILNWSENKVKITTSRALASLKKELEKKGERYEEVFSNG